MKNKTIDNSKYYNNVVIKVMSGEKFGNWDKLVQYVLTLPEKEAMIDYPELTKAIKRYQEIESIWNKIQNDRNFKNSKEFKIKTK